MKKTSIIKAGAGALAAVIVAAGFALPAQASTVVSSNAINTYSRAAVAAAYANQWLPATNSAINWTGNAANCQPGTQSADSLVKGTQAINFYRGMVGLDSVSLTSAQNTMAQAAALMMEANGTISHTPPTSWNCYTALGSEGASTSNLMGGAGSFNIASAATPIQAYMGDAGGSNYPVGHRRWVLNPSTVTMGLGTTQGFNALNVSSAAFDSTRTDPNFIGFPGSGYFPQQLEPNGRWSLSSDKGVDFSAATVSVKDANGKALSVYVEPIVSGYGPDTIVFEVSGYSYATGSGESAYTVTVNNMKKNNLPFSYTYTTRLFDGNVTTANVAPSDPMPAFPKPIVSIVPQAPTFGATSYTIPTYTGAIYKVNGVVTAAGTYNASSAISITAEATSGYALAGQTSWSKDYTPVVVQPITVVPTAPTFNATSFTIPFQQGLRYLVNGAPMLWGTYTAPYLVNITAVALDGYKISGTSAWSKDYTPASRPIAVTPKAPSFGSTTYTIPVTTGVDYLVGGNVKAAGTYSANTLISISARAKTGYTLSGTASWSKNFTRVPNPSIKAPGDVVAMDPSGNLWDYGTLQSGRRLIGAGWSSMKNLNIIDWNSDGIMDIIATDSNGNLRLYKGGTYGGFSNISLGSGWKNYDVFATSWVKGSKYPSIVARDRSTGKLFHYANNSGLAVSTQALIGTGWNGLGINITDWDKDGNADVIVKTSAGKLLLYRTNGKGNFLSEARAVIGSGWGSFSTTIISNFRGSNTDGIIGKRSDGLLYYYQMNPSRFASPLLVGNGWWHYTIANK